MVATSKKRVREQQKAKQQDVALICIVDKSGSMLTTRDEAVLGYNKFLDEQAKQPGNAAVTLVLFDTVVRTLYRHAPVQMAPRLDNDNYVPEGFTALLDAVGRTINEVKREVQAFDKVICAIVTDGGENASREYNRAAVRALLAEVEATGWEVYYIGANQDAFAEAGAMGISLRNIAAAAAGGQGMSAAFMAHANNTTTSRAFSGKYDTSVGYQGTQPVYDAALATVSQEEKAKKNTPKQ